ARVADDQPDGFAFEEILRRGGSGGRHREDQEKQAGARKSFHRASFAGPRARTVPAKFRTARARCREKSFAAAGRKDGASAPRSPAENTARCSPDADSRSRTSLYLHRE